MANINKDYLTFGVKVTMCDECERIEVIRCRDCDLLQDCKISQYLGLDGYCSNAEVGCE